MTLVLVSRHLRCKEFATPDIYIYKNCTCLTLSRVVHFSGCKYVLNTFSKCAEIVPLLIGVNAQ